jgi:HAMP domain-containing protein
MKHVLGLLSQLQLHTKLLLAMGIGFVITLVVGLASIVAIRTLSNTNQQTYEQDLVGISSIMEAQVDLTLMGRELRWMAMSSAAPERAKARKSVVEAQAQVRLHIEEGRKRIFRDEGKAALQTFDAVFPLYTASVNHVVALLDNGTANSDAEASQFLASAAYDKVIVSADQALDAIVKLKREGAHLAAQRAEAVAGTSQQVAIALLLLGLLLSVVFGLLVGASIRLPLKDLRSSVEDLAAGRLDIVVPHTGQRHEIGAMADAIQVLQLGARATAEQDWVKRSLSEVDQAVLTAASYQEFANRLGSCLAPVLGLVYAALYVPDATGVQRVGGYGCDDSVQPLHFAWGEGLVGQVAKDLRTLTLGLAGHPVDATLGMGLLQTRHVQVWAVCDRSELLAVLEIGAQAPLSSQQLAFVEVLLPSLASRIKILVGTVATRELLAQVQAQSAGMQSSEPTRQGSGA